MTETHQLDNVTPFPRALDPMERERRDRALAVPWTLNGQTLFRTLDGDEAVQDSLPSLLAIGFAVASPTCAGGYYQMAPPPGWTKSTEGCVTAIYDDQYRLRVVQYDAPYRPHLCILPLVRDQEH